MSVHDSTGVWEAGGLQFVCRIPTCLQLLTGNVPGAYGKPKSTMHGVTLLLYYSESNTSIPLTNLNRPVEVCKCMQM